MLQLLKPTERARLMGCLIWVEDLERAKLTYGDLLAFLEGLHMACVVSPIHDEDTYTADDVRGWRNRHLDPDTGEVADEYTNREPKVGDKKKPHIHVYFNHKGPKAPRAMSRAFDEFIPGLIADNRWVAVPDWEAIVRYCAHMDSPNKAQYDPLKIHGFANADMSGIWNQKTVQPMKVMMEVEKAIRRHKIPNYYRLNTWANATGDIEVINAVKGRTSHWTAIFNAMRQERVEQAERKKEAERKKNRESMDEYIRQKFDEVAKGKEPKD